MPLVWQDPEIALIHRGVIVYHTYKEDNLNCKLEYHYSFGMNDRLEFDVRDLRCPHDWDVANEKDRRRIIRLAIERGELTVPDGCLPDCKHESLRIDSYVVILADTTVELVRHASTGEVLDFEINRIDGDVNLPNFYCEDCKESFTWKQVQGF